MQQKNIKPNTLKTARASFGIFYLKSCVFSGIRTIPNASVPPPSLVRVLPPLLESAPPCVFFVWPPLFDANTPVYRAPPGLFGSNYLL